MLMQRFRNRYFSGRRYLYSLSDVSVTELSGQSSQWIVSRGHCSFLSVDLSSVESGLRLQALENQLELLSPVETFDYWVRWNNGLAEVWLWDKVDVEDQLVARLDPEDKIELIDIYPESAFSFAKEDGVVLYNSLDGVVVQLWSNGGLGVERFFREMPDEDTWAKLLRSQGLMPQPLPEPVGDLMALARPAQNTRLDVNFKVIEPSLIAGVCGFFILLLSYQLSSLMLSFTSTLLTETELNELRSSKQRVTLLKSKTHEIRGESRLLSTLGENRQLLMMHKLLDQMPVDAEGKGQLQEWDYKEGRLEILVKNPVLSLTEYAERLEQIDGFENVGFEPNPKRGTLTISMDVAG